MPDRQFEALGKSGAVFHGLETFSCSDRLGRVIMTSHEVTSLCPITGQPDFYSVEVDYDPAGSCIESKSLKLFLGTFRDKGGFGEDMAVQILDAIVEVCKPTDAEVTVKQIPRGGIGIVSIARYHKPVYA